MAYQEVKSSVARVLWVIPDLISLVNLLIVEIQVKIGCDFMLRMC